MDEKSEPNEIGAVAQDREPHERLDRAIDRIEELSDRLDALNNRINGDGSDGKADSSTLKSTPPLRSLLEKGPDRIEEKIDDCHEQIARTEGLLFSD